MEADNQQHPYTSDSCLNEQQAAKVVMLATNTLRNDRVRNRLNIPISSLAPGSVQLSGIATAI
ncbi:MAG: hypothetical protein IPJ38_06360 [Dechloromonas sp.]|uniref:Uncharacterized protein n=1 Tax=Candidatus Dechloromonas phosphorivorans TaxID=2899244 RepID=A0A935K1D3_9RHOO|nr:hypothetical protein [Candidatus Dechloromonas phosphorivorans]